MLYFTSDHHFWHNNIIKFCKRPFASVEEMNKTMIQNWNNTVSTEDTIYYLGDFSMAARLAEIYTPKLNGIKYLVPGNHYFCHSYHKKSRTPEGRARWIKHYEDWGWIVLPEQTKLYIPKIGDVHLCHHPYSNLSTEEDKYAQWRPHDYGHWLLCGHIHDKWKIMNHMINVGVAVWDFKPVSVVEIIKIIHNRTN